MNLISAHLHSLHLTDDFAQTRYLWLSCWAVNTSVILINNIFKLFKINCCWRLAIVMSKVKIAVIGAGVIGLSVAVRLLESRGNLAAIRHGHCGAVSSQHHEQWGWRLGVPRLGRRGRPFARHHGVLARTAVVWPGGRSRGQSRAHVYVFLTQFVN